jgi:ABC-type nitrate/sulfonate/bicarbonate transport system ATPase subunit/ABC-type transporter Mla maintaining outer membrane lipid asymmetry permease subunit MlaE
MPTLASSDPERARGLAVAGLSVVLPSGERLLDDVALQVAPGEVVVLLGGSGAGKSTFARVLFEPEALAADGFDVQVGRLDVARGQLGLVPQKGALFDHLDVAGNIQLALDYAGRADGKDPAEWLASVGLDPALAAPGTQVARLSGGQAQRVAVARVLAGRRPLLFLDEPSVGLDPLRVRQLARLVRRQVDEHGASAIVVTHDVQLAAGVADRLFVLDPAARKLEELWPGQWPGPQEADGVSEAERGRRVLELEAALCERIARGETAARVSARPPRSPRLARALVELTAPLAACVHALGHAPVQLATRGRDFARVFARVLVQALLRPLPFYLVVAALVGYTVLYVISKVGGAGVRADAGIRLVGGATTVALAPVLSAVLFVAASGNAVNAWLGSMALTRQTLAMRALGVPVRAYLFAPTWLALGMSYLVIAGLFALAMIVGGWVLCRQLGLPGAWALLTADFVDPRPERVKYLVRAGFLVWMYAWGIASDVVAKGGADKPTSGDVTRAMTRSVVAPRSSSIPRSRPGCTGCTPRPATAAASSSAWVAAASSAPSSRPTSRSARCASPSGGRCSSSSRRRSSPRCRPACAASSASSASRPRRSASSTARRASRCTSTSPSRAPACPSTCGSRPAWPAGASRSPPRPARR